MAKKKPKIPEYGTVILSGVEYYRTRVKDADGKTVALYALTKEELYQKEMDIRRQIADTIFHRENPTVAEYCEKWLRMKSATVSKATLRGYASTMNHYIIKPLGEMYLSDVTADDIQIALVSVSKLSASMYTKVNMLFKCIFYAAERSHLLDYNPSADISAKGGRTAKEKDALSDEQVTLLLEATKGLPPYTFIMIALYSGLRREEILALQWDSVYLDVESPYLTVRRAWHTENNRPVILDELKTKAAKRDIPLPDCLAQCLREAKEASKSDYVVANSEGNPLSYTQFKRLWQYIVTRTAKERTYYRYDENGHRIKHTVHPVLGQKAAHNGNVVYTLDFDVTPHQLRHTYITNLLYAGVDPKTVQYLAGHENSKTTMDIYAKVKYNRPAELLRVVNAAFEQRTGT